MESIIMQTVLILGGTRYIGKEFLNHIRKNFKIIVLSRIKDKDTQNIKSFVIDRNSKKSIERYVKNKKFHFVFDFINFTSFHSSIIHELIIDKKLNCEHYIMISTSWVYNKKNQYSVSEKSFNPSKFNYKLCNFSQSYEMSKRNSESFIAQKFTIPYTIVRFPIILAVDDYTGRFSFIPNHIKDFIFHKDPCKKKFQVVFKQDAVNFLISILNNSVEGIFHFSCEEIISEEILWNFFLTYSNVKKKYKKVSIANSPFKFSYDLTLDCCKAYKLYKPGNTFALLEEEYNKFKNLNFKEST